MILCTYSSLSWEDNAETIATVILPEEGVGEKDFDALKCEEFEKEEGMEALGWEE